MQEKHTIRKCGDPWCESEALVLWPPQWRFFVGGVLWEVEEQSQESR